MARFYFITYQYTYVPTTCTDGGGVRKEIDSTLSEVHPLEWLENTEEDATILFWKEIDEELYYKYKEKYKDG